MGGLRRPIATIQNWVEPSGHNNSNFYRDRARLLPSRPKHRLTRRFAPQESCNPVIASRQLLPLLVLALFLANERWNSNAARRLHHELSPLSAIWRRDRSVHLMSARIGSPAVWFSITFRKFRLGPGR